jgi:hypothetical protein
LKGRHFQANCQEEGRGKDGRFAIDYGRFALILNVSTLLSKVSAEPVQAVS